MYNRVLLVNLATQLALFYLESAANDDREEVVAAFLEAMRREGLPV